MDHEVKLVFTRMPGDPTDHTPGVLSLDGADGRKLNSTQDKQLPLHATNCSPVVMVPAARVGAQYTHRRTHRRA